MQVYRNAPYFQKFKKEYPELEKRLTKEIIKKLDNLRIGEKKSESLKQFDGDLYEAYKIMRSYGALDTDLSFLRKP